VVARAREALAARQLARAIGLADRASALAPDDADVRALTETIARGGRRRRSALIAGVAVAIAAGGAAVVMTRGSGGTAAASSPIDARAPDAAAIAAALPIDAPAVQEVVGPPDATTVAIAPPADAAPLPHRADARVRAAIDAAPPEVDAAPAPTPPVDASPPPDAAPAPARVRLVMDAWCDLTIDGVPRGRASRAPIELPPGHHDLTCSQGRGGASWSGAVELVPGDSQTVTGALFAKVSVTLELDAVIDGVAHKQGEVVPLDRGRHRVDGRGWFSVTAACRLRASPELDCY
jgi:hypothetical protein